MKKLLAENMLRFGVKNLTESQINKIQLLTEQASPPALLKIIGLENLAKNKATAYYYNYFKTKVSNFGIKFSNAIPDPIAYLTAGYLFTRAQNPARVRQLSQKQDILKVFGSKAFTGGFKFKDKAGEFSDLEKYILQLNQSQSQKGKIATVGVISAEGGADSGTPGQASSYSDIQIFLNDSNLKLYVASGYSHYLQPYTVEREGRERKIKGNDFIEGDPKTTPGAGSFDITSYTFEVGESGTSTGITLYGTINFDAESSQTTGTTETTTTFEPGAEISPELGKLFVTGKIQLAAGKADEIAAAVKDAQKLGKIVKIRIESSASHGRGTKMTREKFAGMVGLPVDQVPQNPSVNNKSDNVTDPMEGGNAFLAVKRAQVAGAAVKSVSPVTPTITAKIQDGGDAAQYVKVFMTVQKPDNTTTITQDDLKNIGAGASSSNVSGKFQMTVINIS